MSRINFGAKPNMYPLPVLIIATYDKDGNPDAMNAAWGVVTDFNEISISMGDHQTTLPQPVPSPSAWQPRILLLAAITSASSPAEKFQINLHAPVSMQRRANSSTRR